MVLQSTFFTLQLCLVLLLAAVTNSTLFSGKNNNMMAPSGGSTLSFVSVGSVDEQRDLNGHQEASATDEDLLYPESIDTAEEKDSCDKHDEGQEVPAEDGLFWYPAIVNKPTGRVPYDPQPDLVKDGVFWYPATVDNKRTEIRSGSIEQSSSVEEKAATNDDEYFFYPEGKRDKSDTQTGLVTFLEHFQRPLDTAIHRQFGSERSMKKKALGHYFDKESTLKRSESF